MSNAVLSSSTQPRSPVVPARKTVVTVVLAVWLALVSLLGAGGAFASPPGTPPLPILIGFAAPIIAFFAGFRLSRPFREFVLSTDLRLAMGIQAWRFAGLAFLDLYMYGVLPGIFAWPAGLGDIAVGVTAPWILVALIRQPGFAASKAFVVWNVLGVLDLVVALGTGALGVVLATAGEASTGPMAQLPLVLVPAYLVPIFMMLHATALIQARRLSTTLSEQA
jgi:hypothetical protein